MLKELIEADDTQRAETELDRRKAGDRIEAYILAQSVTVQEMRDIVAEEYDPRHTSSGQVSVYQILCIAKKAILSREAK